MTYTRADKARTIEVYLAEGATAAAREIGCTRQAVYLWLAEFDTDPKKGERARAATVERLRLKRAAMVELFHDKALELAAAVDPADPSSSRFMLAACQAADKALLMVGLVKKASDPARLTMGELEAWIAELEEERAKVAPAESRSVDVDKELSRMRVEMERKIRGEVLADFDQQLAEAPHMTPERLQDVTGILSQLRGGATNGHPAPPRPEPAGAPVVIVQEEEKPKPRHVPRRPRDVGPTW